MKKPLIIIGGPTACGKTSTAIHLAKKIGGEIISADSMQVYKYMDIGTAKPSKEEMDGIPHYLIDELYPDEEFNGFLYRYSCIYPDWFQLPFRRRFTWIDWKTRL